MLIRDTISTTRSLTTIIRREALAVTSSSRPHLPSPTRHTTGTVNRRHISWKSSSDGGQKSSLIFGGLVGLGALVTIYGLFEYYYTSQTWPEPIRSHLRNALKLRNRGEYEQSEAYFRQAISAALALPPSALSPDPLQKLSGLYISLAAQLESQRQPVAAYALLSEALSHFGNGNDVLRLGVGSTAGEWACREGVYHLDDKDHVRAIALTQKLGHLALQIGSVRSPPPYPNVSSSSSLSSTTTPPPSTWIGAAEMYLSSALTAMLKLGLSSPASGAGREATNGQVVLGRDLDLSSVSTTGNAGTSEEEQEEQVGRVDAKGVGMTMEALSEVYAIKGRYDLASQLLLQAISLLLPPTPTGTSKEAPPIRDRCQAAMLMTTLSSHLARPQTSDSSRIAKSWSLRALQIADGAMKDASRDSSLSEGDRNGLTVCARAKSVGAYNLGMMAELDKESASALKHYQQSGETARKIGFKEGQQEAIEAIRRVGSGEQNDAKGY